MLLVAICAPIVVALFLLGMERFEAAVFPFPRGGEPRPVDTSPAPPLDERAPVDGA